MILYPKYMFQYYVSFFSLRVKHTNIRIHIHRVFTFIVGIQFWHICFSGTFPFLPYSHTSFVFLSLSHSPLSLSLTDSLFLSSTHSPIYLFLSYSPHHSLSLFPPSLSLTLSPLVSPHFFRSI